ncbi:hypothetical protein MKOR_25430 [Mycolicibacillus koreensis]|nr:hypothetical protein MKOR_25430 [Mycolicibacillus koreensis]
MNLGGRRGEPPTGQLTPPPHGQQPSGQSPQQPSPPVAGQPAARPATEAGAPPPVEPPPAATGSSGGAGKRRRTLRSLVSDPLSILLILITVLALVAVGVIGSEVVARRIANGKVADAASCEIQDSVKVSFGVTPPVLWQHFTGDYTNIGIHSDGNQVRHAKGMTVDINIRNVDLTPVGDSKGTIGSLNAAITWESSGIAETVKSEIPMIGGLAVNTVTTNPNDGTIELKGTFSHIIAKPKVVDGGFALEVVKFSGLGFTLPRESIQSMLDDFTSGLTKDYPLGIRADSVNVTDSGVIAHMSTQNAPIPKTDNPCFKNL